MIENGLTQPAGLLKNSPNAQRYIYAHEVALYQQNNKILAPVVTPDNVRESDWRGRESILPDVAHTVFFPTKAVGALILDTMGTGAWDIMLRRAQELFDSPIRRKDFADVIENESPARGDPVTKDDESDRRQIRRITELVQNRKTHVRVSKTDRAEIKQRMKELLDPARKGRKVDYHARSRAGAVEMLLRRLDEEEKCWKKEKKGEKKNHSKYSITLVGHSMGAIVSNEMLKRHPDLSFDRIIYLAAACSVKDAQDSVVPYLRQRADAGKPAQFYNLSLHPVAETSEAMGGDKGDMSLGGLGKTAAGLIVVPRGSLLHWLDDFFTKPLNYEERRLGKWAAAITSVEMFPKELRPFVHLKMFPVGIKEQHIPEEHGEFGDRHGDPQLFWKEPFLDPKKIYKEPLGNPEDTPAPIDRTALP
jgi:pimeloyl-ACP methyl ester carboxylesterase